MQIINRLNRWWVNDAKRIYVHIRRKILKIILIFKKGFLFKFLNFFRYFSFGFPKCHNQIHFINFHITQCSESSLSRNFAIKQYNSRPLIVNIGLKYTVLANGVVGSMRNPNRLNLSELLANNSYLYFTKIKW